MLRVGSSDTHHSQARVTAFMQKPGVSQATATIQYLPPGSTPSAIRGHPASVRTRETQGADSVGRKVLNYRDAELLMHYFDHVFPLQFRFHSRELNQGNRGWLLWLLVKTGPLYHAALSLSALHQFTLRSDDQGEKYAELHEYHTNALRDLQSFLKEHQGSDYMDERSRHIEVLACGVSMISFEVRASFSIKCTHF